MLGPAMDVLLLLTGVCFLALFGSALLIARHVRIVDVRATEAEEDLPRVVDLKLDEDGPSQRRLSGGQALHEVMQKKEPDWRFLVSGERRRVWKGATSSLPPRKPPVREERRGLRGWTYFDQDAGGAEGAYEPRAEKANWKVSNGRR